MLLIIFLAFGLAASEPIINKCKLTDEACIRKSAEELIPYFAAGIPEYDVPTVDPFMLDVLDFSYLGFKFVLSDVVVTGLKGCKVPKLSIHNSTMYTVMVCDTHITAQYDIEGKLLLLPIRSKGTSDMLLPKIEVTGKTLLKEYVAKDGKKHWAMKNLSRQFKLLDKASIKMDNLCGENSIIIKALNTLFNYYTNDIVYDQLPLVINNLIDQMYKAVSNFFAAVPVDDLIQ